MSEQPKTRKKRPFIKVTIVTLLLLVLGGKWLSYVAFADSPFDDLGEGINAIMPGPLNRLGCDLLKERFGNVPIPPKGCDVDGRWA